MLNLISDKWIPVRRQSGPDIIRPDQIAEADVLRPDWPRPDLNLACLELLVGLVYLACPPGGPADRRRPPDQAQLRAALAPLAPAFNLIGDGPLFLQDLAPLAGEANSPDMLFIDSSGVSTAKKNADLMVKRQRYATLDLPLVAMALYTLQAFAPSGGAGNRTSLRGGGPMVTLVRPVDAGLWPMVWENVPDGTALDPDALTALPWMRPTSSSEAGQIRVPEGGSQLSPDPEVFFGQPRRLRLVSDGTVVTGVIQRPYGTNYTQWRHPLSPYYVTKTDTLPVHPKPGGFGYRNWRGVILQSEDKLRPANLMRFRRDNPGAACILIVAGWAMDNMKPLDFLWSEQPVFPLAEAAEYDAEAMVEAAEQASYALAACVRDGVGEVETATGTAQSLREAFFAATQPGFEAAVAGLSAGAARNPALWVKTMRSAALPLFDAAVLPGLADLSETRQKRAVAARGKLLAAFSGRPPFGKKIYDPLELDQPAKPDRKEPA